MASAGPDKMFVSGRSGRQARQGDYRQRPPVIALALSGNGSQAAIGLGNKVVRICSVDDGKEIRKIGPLPASITALCFRNEAGQIAVGGDDKVVRVIAAGDGKVVKELKAHSDRITSLAFAPQDGNLVFSGSADRTVRLWNVNEVRVIREFPGHAAAVLTVQPNRDGSKLATGFRRSDGPALERWRR